MQVLMLGVLSCPVLGFISTLPTLANGHGFTRKRLEEITVKFVDGTSTNVDKYGENCLWVPYYLCDADNVEVQVNNASVTGWGTLDSRFGDDNDNSTWQYREVVEVCCTIPKDSPEMAPVVPTTSTTPKPLTTSTAIATPKPMIPDSKDSEAKFGEFPWVVALLNADNSSYAGAGALINPKVVMTIAHIAKKFAPGTLKIRAGEWDTQTVNEMYAYQERTVQDIYIHENYDPNRLKNDIALLLLEETVVISVHIKVIWLPRQDEVFDSYKNCVANAWKKDEFDLKGRNSVILKKVEMDMVPYSRCNTLLKRTRLGNKFRLDNSFVCAGGEEGKDTCQGGAPLACPIGNNRYKLTGLVSWGIGCGRKDVPAIYVNVPLFTNWVNDKLKNWGLQ